MTAWSAWPRANFTWAATLRLDFARFDRDISPNIFFFRSAFLGILEVISNEQKQWKALDNGGCVCRSKCLDL